MDVTKTAHFVVDDILARMRPNCAPEVLRNLAWVPLMTRLPTFEIEATEITEAEAFQRMIAAVVAAAM